VDRHMATRRTSRGLLSEEEIAAAQQALRELLEKHGRQTVVADLLGFTQQSISAALRKNNPQIGPALARAIEEHVGRPLVPPTPPTSTPERWVERPVRYENLRKVVTSLRGQLPDEFLDEVLLSAALYSPTDLPEASWKAMLEGFYAEWRGKAATEPLEGDPVAEAMAKARKRVAKKGASK